MLQTAIAYARPGDVLANACQAKGLGGLITDTGVRDTEGLRALGFPVFFRSVSIKGTVKETVGPMCEPVTASQERVDAEVGHISAYRAGKTVVEMCGRAPLLAAKGLVIEEQTPSGASLTTRRRTTTSWAGITACGRARRVRR